MTLQEHYNPENQTACERKETGNLFDLVCYIKAWREFYKHSIQLYMQSRLISKERKERKKFNFESLYMDMELRDS